MASETKPVPQPERVDQPTPNQITLTIDRKQTAALLECIDARLQAGGVNVDGAAFLLGLFSKIKSAMG